MPPLEPRPTQRPALARALPLLVVLASLCLHAPSLAWGFFADDHVHALILDGRLIEEGFRPWALYEFGTLADAPHLRDTEGTLPYWTGDDWRASFLRPVASAVRWLEHGLFDGAPLGAHVSGLLWWAVFLLLAHRLFLRLGLAPGAALWALLLLALENGAALGVGWCANRNTTVEGVFLLAGVLLFVRGLSGPRTRPLLLLGGFAAALLATLAKESGVATFALFAGWCWLGRRSAAVGPDRGRAFLAARTRWGAAAALSAAAYVTAYVALGFGTRSLFYPTPWGEPGAWLGRLAFALPGGVVATTTPLVTDVVHVLPALAPWLALLGLALAAVLWRFVAPSAKAHGAGPFLALFALVTVLPQAGAPLADRLFLVPMVGVAGLLGIALHATTLRLREGWARPTERAMVRGIIVSCIGLSGLALVVTELGVVKLAAFSRAAIRTAEVGSPTLGRRDVYVLQSPSQLVSLQPTAAHLNLTGDEEVRFRVLNATRRGVRWTRTGPRTFTLASLDDPFLTSLFERVFLTAEPHFSAGHTWRAGPLTVRALSVDDGRPVRVEVTLARDLDDPRQRFLVWDPDAAVADEALGRWVHVPPPRVGETLEFATRPAPLPLLP